MSRIIVLAALVVAATLSAHAEEQFVTGIIALGSSTATGFTSLRDVEPFLRSCPDDVRPPLGDEGGIARIILILPPESSSDRPFIKLGPLIGGGGGGSGSGLKGDE